jgi:hypothetical protein
MTYYLAPYASICGPGEGWKSWAQAFVGLLQPGDMISIRKYLGFLA